MYMKIFPHGKGGGTGPVNYLVRLDYSGRQEEPPQVLRGDPDMTRELIDSQDRVWKFTAGVLSWAPGENVTPEQENVLMNDFESVAFAGLKPDQFDILWVRHAHAGHHELHFVIPRMELYTGKAFNPCPPGWQKDFDVFRDLHNWREGWARPDDPERARAYKPAHTDLARARDIRWGKTTPNNTNADPRKLIHDYIAQRIEAGIVTNRAELVQSLHEAGLSTPRTGKNYITVMDPDSWTRFRMKGGIYSEHWRFENQAPGQDQRGPQNLGTNNAERIRELAAQLKRVIKKRAEYNQGRYCGSSRGHERGSNEQTSTPGAADRETAKYAGVELVEVGHAGRMSDVRSYFGRMGPECSGQRLCSRPMESDFRTPARKGKPARDSSPVGTEDLGNSATRDDKRPIHFITEKSDSQDWLDHERPRRHQTGAIDHEHDRAGAPLAGRTGEAARRIRSRSGRSERTYRTTLRFVGATRANNATAQRVLQKFGAVVGAVEQFIAKRRTGKELKRKDIAVVEIARQADAVELQRDSEAKRRKQREEDGMEL